MRTTKGTLTFVRPLRPGDEEPLEGMSFPAYQRTAMMQLRVDPERSRVTEIATVDRRQLEEAPTMDGLRPPMSNIDPPTVEP